jgi:A/G-specific adenine glycosylase
MLNVARLATFRLVSIRVTQYKISKRQKNSLDRFAQQLLDWYAHSGRKDLPWQHPREPYRVWLSEIMLQQTQVATVIPYFEKFLQRFPTIIDLADAELDQVLRLWAGLGYYARARNLHSAAIQIRDKFQGQFPSSQEDLESLPGIGRSTAGAILAQAFSKRGVILDGNVRRVLCRYHGIDSPPQQAATQKELWRIADSHTPNKKHADYAQAIMDLGATICARRASCEMCPVKDGCVALAENLQDKLPTKVVKKADKPIRNAHMLVFKNDLGEIFLEKRPPSGIWGGLFCPPVIYFETAQEASISGPDSLPLRRHSFSHFHLDFIPVLTDYKESDRVLDSDLGLWYNLNSPVPGGLPAPVSRLFKELTAKQ